MRKKGTGTVRWEDAFGAQNASEVDTDFPIQETHGEIYVSPKAVVIVTCFCKSTGQIDYVVVPRRNVVSMKLWK